MSKYNTDLSPAILELKKLHNMILDAADKRMSTELIPQGLNSARETVISIIPGERRREDGWYRWRMWEKRSDEVLHELSKDHKIEKYHEIFISGEALKGDREDVVLLMMHQVAHQAATIQSVQSYHSEWIKIWFNRLYAISPDAWERDEVLGWYKLDKTKLGEGGKLVSQIASRLAPDKFDLFRRKLTKAESVGKMNKWLCDCKSPAVRTGGLLYATCEKCNTPFKIVPKGVQPKFLNRVPKERRWES